MHVCPHSHPRPPSAPPAWPCRIYLGSGGEAAVLQLKKNKNKTKIQRNRRKQCKEANRLPRPPPFLLCLSVRPLGEAAAEAKFQFRGYCIFSQPLSRLWYTLCTADCM